MIRTTLITALFSFLLLNESPALAHFGMVIPDTPQLNQERPSTRVRLSFSHPFTGQGMDMARPAAIFALKENTRQDLGASLEPTTIMGQQGWQFTFQPQRPGVHWLVMEPQPYWEPAEDLLILHTTKTAVSAYGGDEGWAVPLGLKTEIVPLVRPFALYAGNSFRGQVLLDGRPVPASTVEVEYYNQDGRQAASEAHISQTIITDAQGLFSFTCPWPGWWGFAALNTGNFTLPDPSGNPKEVELGAVLWIYLDPLPQPQP